VESTARLANSCGFSAPNAERATGGTDHCRVERLLSEAGDQMADLTHAA